MVRRVIVPIGFEMADQATIGIAAALARRLSGEVELVTVCSARDAARAERHLVAIAEGHSPTARWRVIEGDDVEGELVGQALSHPEALLCLSSLARRSMAESMWGSVSEQLARDAGVPLILVGPHATRRVGTASRQVILVPVDGTTVGTSILSDAFDLAGQLRLNVRLVQVVDPSDVPPDVRSSETTYLHNLSKDWASYEHSVDYDVLHGNHAGRAITDYVETHGEVVLIAMATRGVPVPGRLFYPSTTFAVLRRSAAPVLVLHAVSVAAERTSSVADTAAQPTSMVVVGLDDLASSRPALVFAAEEASRRHVPLRIVHAWLDPVVVSGRMSVIVLAAQEQAECEELETVGSAVEAVHQLFPNVQVDTVVACDSPARLIAMSATNAELVVIGRHRSSRLHDSLLGSTSDHVAHRVLCPVVSITCPSER
jgi:nucleotide-binding universal stress UspA family protein